jgi:ABC-type Na+ transport system ATPase subunit NatA
MPKPFAIQHTDFNARAVLFAERIDLKGLRGANALATNPLAVEVKGGGMAVLLTTHYMDEAERCHRVGLVHRGRLVLEGEPAALMAGHASFEEVFLSRVEEAG